MTKDQIANLKRLVGLFDERDRLHQKATEEIFEAIGPTVLEALITLFDVPYENVEWLEAQLFEGMLLLAAAITYTDGKKVPPIIQDLSSMPITEQPSVRLFRLGLPAKLLFQTKEEILEYLKTTAKAGGKETQKSKAPESDEHTIPINTRAPEFDTSGLTHEQIQQLLIFGGTTPGTKH